MIFYGGQQLTDDDPGLLERVEAVLSLDDLYDFTRATWPGRAAAIAFPHQERETKPVLNRLVWPSGASRWAMGWFLTDDVGLAAIRPLAYAGHTLTALPFVMSDGQAGITTDLFMMPPRPLGQCGTGGDLYLLGLVDERYFWWDAAKDFTALFTPAPLTTTWAELLDSYGEGLGITIAHDTIPSGYHKPPPMFGIAFGSIPQQLDAACAAVGLRLVRKLDGTVRAISATTAATTFAANVALNPLAAGGLIAAGDSVILPSSVAVVGPLEEATVVACPVAGAVLYSAQKVLRTPILGASPTQIAADWYAWQTARPDAAYSGVCPWTPGGFEDRIEWTHRDVEISTRVQRAPWNERADLAEPYGTRAAFTLSDVPAFVSGTPGVGTAQLQVIVDVLLAGTSNVVTVFNLLPHAIPTGSEVGLILEPYSDRWLIISDGCGLTVTDGTTTLENVGTLNFPNSMIGDGGDGNCGRIANIPTFATIHTCDITLIDPPPVGTFILTVCSGSGGSGGTVTNIYNYYLYLGDNFYLTLSCCGMIGGSGHSGGSGGGGGGGGHILACCPGLVLGGSLHLFIFGCDCIEGSQVMTYYPTGNGLYAGIPGWMTGVFECSGHLLQFALFQNVGGSCSLHVGCGGVDTNTTAELDATCDPLDMTFIFPAGLIQDGDGFLCCGTGEVACTLTE